MRAVLVASSLACALVLAASPGATAGGGFRTTVKILDDSTAVPKRNYFPHFTGTVRSPKDRCERRRTVDLFKEAGAKDPLVGSDTTNRNGRFRIMVDKPLENDFYAIVPRLVIAAGKCRADQSPVFHHDGP